MRYSLRRPVGISAVEYALPATKMTAQEISLASGLSEEEIRREVGLIEKPILKAGESSIDYAIKAAKKIFSSGIYSVSDIDFVLYGSCGTFEKRAWSAAAKIQNEIGASKAFAFDIFNGCNSSNLGIHLAMNLLESHGRTKSALVVTSDALARTVDYSDPTMKCIYGFSDAGSAALLRKEEPRNQPLSYVSITNAKFCDELFIPQDSVQFFMSDNPETDREISSEYRKQYVEMILAAVDDARLTLGDIDHLLMNQGDHRLIDYLAEVLPLAAHKIQRSHAFFGHMGASDILFGLKEGLDSGRFARGEHVVLASSAIGFSWGASVIRL